MKKVFPLLLVLCLLLPLAACRDEDALPPDYVKQDKIVIDNETPFVYTEDAPNIENTYQFWGLSHLDEPLSYREFAEYFGSKIIRHYVADGEEYYYTVYSMPDNCLAYIWMQPDEEGTLRVCHPFNEYFMGADALRAFTDVPVYEHDRLAAILGDRLPADYRKESYSFDEVAERVQRQWQNYSFYCAVAGLESQYDYLYDPDVDGFYRCMQSVSFDIVSDAGIHATDGLYVYDLIQYSDGTNTLRFRHLSSVKYPRYDPEQDETVPLTKEETIALLSVFEEADFQNIPTWNPEERAGFDGETTYVLGNNEHLIAMWSADEQYGIYKIRTAFEEIVREKITVTSGRIYETEETA